MRNPSSGASTPSPETSSTSEGAETVGEVLAEQLYRRAVETGAPAQWHIFHTTGDILFTADVTKGSDNIRRLQALRRANEVVSRGRTPRFSHVLMCVMPGLFIESTPASWRIDDDSPAVRFIRAEDCDWSDRSDFQVMRLRSLGSQQRFCVKIQERCIFHGGKPYHYYLFGDHEDRVFCSELVTRIYEETGIRLVPSRQPSHTFPFDLELALGDSNEWTDVTALYTRADDLQMRALIRSEEPDLRSIFLRNYEATTAIAVSLTEVGKAADQVVNDYREQMSRPVQLSPDWQKQTYVSNLRELFGLLQRDFSLYAQFRRFEYLRQPRERSRYNGIEGADLLKKLNAVEATRTKAAQATIGVILSDFKSECRRAQNAATIAKVALADDQTEKERADRYEQLSKLISNREVREPASERDLGLVLINEIADWVRMAESVDVFPDADGEIIKGFLLCGRALHLLAAMIKGPFYGAKVFKLIKDVADLSTEDAKSYAELAPKRKSLCDDLEERCTMFNKLIALRPGRAQG
jgi:hypothetical protein